MHFNFELILTLLSLATGVIWGIDHWWLAPKRRARRAAAGKADYEPRLVEWSRTLFPVVLLVLLFRSFLFEPFKIPSGSMIPTLLIGDFILVNKFSYGLRLPVVHKRIIRVGEPRRGDVFVFRYPEDVRQNYIKRLVGLPGDEITYRNKVLYVNGEPVLQRERGLWIGEGLNRNPANTRPQLRYEELNDVNHRILVYPNRPNHQTQTWTVPDGHYFAMGDNRDMSLDSRHWGFVPEENLVGKAVRIWMHWDCGRGCVVFNRIGGKIE